MVSITSCQMERSDQMAKLNEIIKDSITIGHTWENSNGSSMSAGVKANGSYQFSAENQSGGYASISGEGNPGNGGGFSFTIGQKF